MLSHHHQNCSHMTSTSTVGYVCNRSVYKYQRYDNSSTTNEIIPQLPLLLDNSPSMFLRWREANAKPLTVYFLTRRSLSVHLNMLWDYVSTCQRTHVSIIKNRLRHMLVQVIHALSLYTNTGAHMLNILLGMGVNLSLSLCPSIYIIIWQMELLVTIGITVFEHWILFSLAVVIPPVHQIPL